MDPIALYETITYGKCEAMIQRSEELRASVAESAKPEWVRIGQRLASIRGASTQAEMAQGLSVSKTTYSRWERGVRELGADGLTALVLQGWSANWLLTGQGAERIGDEFLTHTDSQINGIGQSQPVSHDDVKLAAQLLQEALNNANAQLAPAQYGEALVLLVQLLEKGLPEADVRPFARQTVGMITTGVRNAGAASAGR